MEWYIMVMKKQETEEMDYLLDEDTGRVYKLVKINPLKRPCFCPQCKHVRGEETSPTYLLGWDDAYFKSWGMCRTCFDYINSHKEEFKELSGNVKVSKEGKVEIERRT